MNNKAKTLKFIQKQIKILERYCNDYKNEDSYFEYKSVLVDFERKKQKILQIVL